MKIPAAKVFIPEEDKEWILQRISEALSSGWLTLGNFNKELAQEFAEYHKAQFAVPVNSGTAALEIILRVLDAQDKGVVVPTNTFFATAAAVVHSGGKLQLADVNPETFTLNRETVEKAMDETTKGVIIVHIGGIVSPEVEELRDFCAERGLFLVEDAAHAHGSALNGKFAGTFGIASAFSFYPTKVITSGEGGIILTDDEEIYKEALVYRDQGKAGFYGNFHIRMGYNWRMSELHAIVGLAQLRRLDEFISQRQKIARIYDEGLANIEGINPLPIPAGVRSCYYKYIALLDKGIDRNALKKKLKEEYEVSLSGEVYDTPLHKQPIFEKYANGEYPCAEDICSRHICLPIYSNMTEAEAEYVLESLEKAIKEVKE
jgi:dTDP-4-amino-4,6-dideoxygalactose transaminase